MTSRGALGLISRDVRWAVLVYGRQLGLLGHQADKELYRVAESFDPSDFPRIYGLTLSLRLRTKSRWRELDFISLQKFYTL